MNIIKNVPFKQVLLLYKNHLGFTLRKSKTIVGEIPTIDFMLFLFFPIKWAVEMRKSVESNSFRFMWFHLQIRWMRFMETTINNEFYIKLL